MNIIKNALIIIMLASPVISETKPDITLWGYQGWHPVNDYNDMNVVDDYNNINPYHAATVYLTDMVTVNNINTQYLRPEAIIEIDGALVGTVNMSGAGRFRIRSGRVTNFNAKDYCVSEFRGGAIYNVSIIQGAKLAIYGYDFKLGNMQLTGLWDDGWSFSMIFTDVPANIILVYSEDGITGDYNRDGLVNFKDLGHGDLMFIIKNWLKNI